MGKRSVVAAWLTGLGQRTGYVMRRPGRRLGVSLALAVMLFTGCFAQLGVNGLGVVHAAAKPSYQPNHSPNTQAQANGSGNASGQKGSAPFTATVPSRSADTHTATPPSHAPASVGNVSTHPIAVTLDSRMLVNATTSSSSVNPATTPVVWSKSSEGLLEIGVPQGSVDLSHATEVTAPGAGNRHIHTGGGTGVYSLVFQQTAGGFRGQLDQMGQFNLQFVDGNGQELTGVTLRAPIQIKLHYAPHEIDMYNPASLRLVWIATGNAQKHVQAQFVPLTNDPKNHILSASLATLQSGPLAVTGTESDANTASSEHLQMTGNTGDVSFTVPFTLPPAAGGMTPPLQLVYNSGGPNGRHSNQAPAPWVGDGWDLSLGSISYDTSTQLYYLNDVGGVSDVLLCCTTDAKGNNYFVPHHHPEIRVQVDDNTESPATWATARWFYVYMPDGAVYELGRQFSVLDSKRNTGALRTTVVNNGYNYYEWDLDEAWRPNTTKDATSWQTSFMQGYFVYYWNDDATDPSSGKSFVRDSGLSEIDYNYVGGQPQAKVITNIHWPGGVNAGTTYGGGTASQYNNNYNCSSTPPQTTTLRCDDPPTLSGYLPGPTMMSTLTLDDVVMQVKDSGGAWHTVRDYALGYSQDYSYYICWTYTQQTTCAGDHVLASVTETPWQIVGGTDTAMPSRQPLTFTYTGSDKNEYHDTTYLPTGDPNAPYDVQTYWRYLTGFTDKQTGSGALVGWSEGFGNTHGVSSGSVTDPTACYVSNTCFTAGLWPDDRQWPRHIVTQIQDTGVVINGKNPTTAYSYQLNQPCSNPTCQEDYWLPPNGYNACGDNGQPPQNPNQTCISGNYADYYNGEYTGFAHVTITHPDNSTTVEQYNAGNGWGTNDWDYPNTNQGQIISTQSFNTDGKTLLEEVDHAYANNACPTISSSGYQLWQSPYLMCMNYEIQQDTCIGGACYPEIPAKPIHFPNVPDLRETWSYSNAPTAPNSNLFYVQQTQHSVTGNDLLADSYTPVGYGSAQPTFTTNNTYIWRDDWATASTSGAENKIYLVAPVTQTVLSDSAGTGWTCTQQKFDGMTSNPTGGGPTSALLVGLPTETDKFTSCGNSGNSYTPSGQVATGTGYDNNGQPLYTLDADATAGIAGHTSCAVSATIFEQYQPAPTGGYTSCMAYDGTQNVYPTNTGNALNQQTTSAYDIVQGVPTSSMDANNATTTYAGPIYEYTGTPHSLTTYLDTYTSTTLPGETYTDGQSSPWTTRTYSYSFCNNTSGTLPCLETDTVSQFDNYGVYATRQLYDRDGRLVETRKPGPDSSHDVVSFTTYNDVADTTFTSQWCEVPALSSSNGGRSTTTLSGYVQPAQGTNTSGAYIDYTQSTSPCYGALGTTTYKDALGRTVASDDAAGTGVGTSGTGCLIGTLHHTSCAYYAVVQASATSGLPTTDSAYYLRTVSIDANLHQSAVYTDARGSSAYSQRFTGSGQTPGSGVTTYAVWSYQYDPSGTVRKTTEPNGSVSSVTTDALGRTTAIADPDLGSWSYVYDPNGNLLQSTDPRAASGGTIYAAYDGLNRQLWRNTTNTPTNAYVTYTYDSTASGNDGVGRLTGESFNPGTTGAGSYAYVYDARGQQTKRTITLGGVAYPLATQYNDAGMMTRFTFSDNEVLAVAYVSDGWLSAFGSTPAGKSQTLLSSTYTYTGAAGFSGIPTSAYLAGSYYTYSASYDNDLRLTNATYKLKSSGATFYSDMRGYDAVGNVSSVQTTLTTGTDTQAFCYDEQNRLVWASAASGTPPCGGSLTGGTLTSAQYTASYSYDTLGRLTSAPLGTYTYGDPNHLDAATSVGSTYSASYDAAGDMTCRAPSNTVTCAGTPTGAAMTYDAERRLATWQNTPSNPTSTASYWYDGEGHRVAQTSNGTTTYYVGDDEEITGSTLLKYYHIPGLPVLGTIVGVTRTYLASDGLGSESVDLAYNGSVLATALYGPYGVGRYATGTMPSSKGYTGQRQDSGSGLDYYVSRYYDPALAQFTSADTAQGPNRYGYVGGNPETANDPTGKRQCDDSGGCHIVKPTSGGSSSGGSGAPTTDTIKAGTDLFCGLLCKRIQNSFQDPTTRSVLMTLTHSVTGIEFLDFLLAAAGTNGDLYISWDLTNGDLGYTDFFGDIHLNRSIFADFGTDTAGFVEAAMVVIHEAVESYYARVDNIRSQASQHMDYVAEWFAGKVGGELSDALGVSVPGTSSYDMTFDYWITTPDGQSYASEPVNQPELTDFWGNIWSNLVGGSSYGPNAMGLTTDMLTAQSVSPIQADPITNVV